MALTSSSVRTDLTASESRLYASGPTSANIGVGAGEPYRVRAGDERERRHHHGTGPDEDVVAEFGPLADEGVVAGLEPVAGDDVTIDDGAGPDGGIGTDDGRFTVRVILVSDGRRRVDPWVLAEFTAHVRSTSVGQHYQFLRPVFGRGTTGSGCSTLNPEAPSKSRVRPPGERQSSEVPCLCDGQLGFPPRFHERLSCPFPLVLVQTRQTPKNIALRPWEELLR